MIHRENEEIISEVLRLSFWRRILKSSNRINKDLEYFRKNFKEFSMTRLKWPYD